MSALRGDQLAKMRRMVPADLDIVMEVESAAYAFPWTREIFSDCLKVGYQCHVLARDHKILGYGVMSLGAGEAHVLNLCVAPDRQGMGIGRQMLRYLIDIAGQRSTETVFLEVRISNTIATRLYLSEGFNEIGRRIGYYPASGRREDALVFAKSLM
ncbi:MAG: ribosomal protein S18-alanine N-acetyltransferase [bacterium]